MALFTDLKLDKERCFDEKPSKRQNDGHVKKKLTVGNRKGEIKIEPINGACLTGQLHCKIKCKLQ